MSLCSSVSGALLGLVLGCLIPIAAQSAWQPGHAGIGFGQPQAKQWVQMISSPDGAIAAGKNVRNPQELALRFVIQTGLHINSHTPHSRFLIPTTLTLDPPVGVEIAKVVYPAGVDYHFSFSPKDALSVYTDEFGVHVQLHARPGHYSLPGQLHYQACDDRACNPPRTLPLTLNVTAR
jgi:hypothetical protein